MWPLRNPDTLPALGIRRAGMALVQDNYNPGIPGKVRTPGILGSMNHMADNLGSHVLRAALQFW